MGVIKKAIALKADPEVKVIPAPITSVMVDPVRKLEICKEQGTDGKDIGVVYLAGKKMSITVPWHPDLAEDEMKKLYDGLLKELAVPPSALPATSLEPLKPETISVSPNSERELPPVGASLKENKMSLDIRYIQGPSFDASYFVAKQGEQVKIVHASRVIPEDVQKLILEGKEDNVASPEEIIEQLKQTAGSSMDTFVAWADKLPKLSKATMPKTAAEWSRAEGEIVEPPMPKDHAAFRALNESEVAEGHKLAGAPEGTAKSPIPAYYNRLPKSVEGGSGPARALNPQSKLLQRKYELLKEALAEAEESKKKAEEKASAAEGKMKDMEKAKGKEDDMKLVENVLAEIKKMTKCTPECEKECLDHLAKVDAKSMPHVLALFKCLHKMKKDDGAGSSKGMGEMGGEHKGPGRPPKPSMGMPAISSLGEGENLPPLYQAEGSGDEPETLVGKMARMWDAGR